MDRFYYLASPYTSDDELLVEERASQAGWAAGELTACGHTVFSPIAYYHNLMRYIGSQHATDFAAFKKHNRVYLNAAHVLIVLTLEGWEDSTGVTWEIDHFRALERPIYFMSLDDVHRRDDFLGQYEHRYGKNYVGSIKLAIGI